jgi:ferredoxin--NADP+ reductase
MSNLGSPDDPLRVAVVGSGPAGFYTVQHLFQAPDLQVTVDMFDRLPTPFGLVRHGVAPDHQKIKSVTAVYHKLAGKPGFRFFGNVAYGRDITLAQLCSHYHQVVFCTGAQTDRRLGIPGEDLAGSHPATEFVAWYNGHPDYADLRFDLSHEGAVVVGVGNVAVDVARILCRSVEELAATDIADHALDALRASRVKVVHLVGRRGPVQAAFTNPEAKELGELEGTETSALAEELELDELSREALESGADKSTRRKVEILRGLADRRQPDRPRKLILRFLLSPVEILGDDRGCVSGVRLVRNELYRADSRALKARATDRFETLKAGLVFRSVGYHGVPLPELPFREDWGIVPNEDGRIVEAPGSAALPGLYVAGWIKRGPTGVIGTNKADAQATVAGMLEDLRSGTTLHPTQTGPDLVPRRLADGGVRYVSYDDWLKLDALEVRAGRSQGRPRVKFTTREQIARALGG